MTQIPDYYTEFVNETNTLMRDQMSRQRAYLERVRMATDSPADAKTNPARVIVDRDINDLLTTGQIDQVTAVFLQSLSPDIRAKYLSEQVTREIATYMQMARLRDPASVPPQQQEVDKRAPDITIETRGSDDYIPTPDLQTKAAGDAPSE